MSVRTCFTLLFLFLTAAIVTGCHLFDNTDELDDPIESCKDTPGYYCPCTPSKGADACIEDLECVYNADSTRGICTAPCDESKDCPGYGGADAVCSDFEGSNYEDYCMISCTPNDPDTYCPPGFKCNGVTTDDDGECQPFTEKDTIQLCTAWCYKRNICLRELDQEIVHSDEECTELCVDTYFAGSACGACQLACDFTADCGPVYTCLGKCKPLCEDYNDL